MPLHIVVGGQYGGEGKGSITAFLAVKEKVDILVETGGPNSAHTFGQKGDRLYRVRMVPCGANLGPSVLVYPAGCLIHYDTLVSELDELAFRGEILIDHNAGIISEDHVSAHRMDPFYTQIGSTFTGTGTATADRAHRRLKLAKEDPRFTKYLTDTQAFLTKALAEGRSVLVEGSQGFGLSSYHGSYPYVTAIDTTVGTFLGQIGLGPNYVDNIVLTIKCLPTRNGVGEGPLAFELASTLISSQLDHMAEYGGGSYDDVGPLRRVGMFDYELVGRAIIANTPNCLAVTGLDRLFALQSIPEISHHYGSPDQFVHSLEQRYGIPVSIQAWGPYIDDIIDKRG